MCVKSGGIWCHPRLAVTEKLPKNGPKSGVCSRGCIMVEFLTEGETENCFGQRRTLRFRFKKLWLVYCSDRAVVTSQRWAKWAFFDIMQISGRRKTLKFFEIYLCFESEAQRSPLFETVFRFSFGQKFNHLQPLKQTPLFWAVFRQFFCHCQTRMAPYATKLGTHNLQKIAVILVYDMPWGDLWLLLKVVCFFWDTYRFF